MGIPAGLPVFVERGREVQQNMDYVAIAGVGFGVLVVGGGLFYSLTQGAKEQAAKYRSGNQQLRISLSDVQEKLRALKELEAALVSRVRLQEQQERILLEQKRKFNSTLPHVERDIVDVLLEENMVSPDQVGKAEQYVAKTGVKQNLDAVFVLLGFVRPDAMERVKRELRESASNPVADPMAQEPEA